MPRRDKEADREYQRRYYQRRKDELAELRKEKYESDPEFRERQQLRSKRQYWLKRRPEKMVEKEAFYEPSPIEDEPLAVLEVTIKDRKDRRHGKTVSVPVYAPSVAAGIVQRSLQTFRLWEYRGVVPPPHFRNRDLEEGLLRGANARLYTRDELEALQQAAPLLSLTQPTSADSAFSRKLHELWGDLTQGVWRKPKS